MQGIFLRQGVSPQVTQCMSDQFCTERTCSCAGKRLSARSENVSEHRLPARIFQRGNSEDVLPITRLVSQVSELFIPCVAIVIADDKGFLLNMIFLFANLCLLSSAFSRVPIKTLHTKSRLD